MQSLEIVFKSSSGYPVEIGVENKVLSRLGI